MEFDELKKIWNEQNNTTMYAINESTLHARISRKRTNIKRWVGLTEIFMFFLNAILGVYLLYDSYVDQDNIFSYLIAIYMMIVAGYALYSRRKRIAAENNFDRSMIADLDHAISYSDYLLKVTRMVIWWYNAPILVLIFAKFLLAGSPVSSYLLMIPFFALAYLLGRWEIKKIHIPRKEKLLSMRRVITDTPDN